MTRLISSHIFFYNEHLYMKRRENETERERESIRTVSLESLTHTHTIYSLFYSFYRIYKKVESVVGSSIA